MKKVIILVTFLALFLVSAIPTSAHRDGCHRWHSCPSDTGSYVCGDLGYTSGCPKAFVPPPTRVPTRKPTNKPTLKPKVNSKVALKKKPTPTPTKKIRILSDRNCPDFKTQKDAQKFFISQGGPTSDPHRLDADHDGIACENNP